MIKRVIAGVMLLALVGGFLVGIRPAAAASTTILLATVKVGTTLEDQYFELSNNTTQPLTLNNWQVCTSRTCDNFSTTVGSQAIGSKLSSSQFPKWRSSGGLSRTSDLLCIKDNTNKVIDCINWGVPDKSAPNYAAFDTEGPLFDPGLVVNRTNGTPADLTGADSNAGVLIFRRATVRTIDTDRLDQWRAVTVASGAAITPAAGTTPAATPKPGATAKAVTTGSTGRPVVQPATGAEFPILVVAGLLLMLLLVRYLRNSRLARNAR